MGDDFVDLILHFFLLGRLQLRNFGHAVHTNSRPEYFHLYNFERKSYT